MILRMKHGKSDTTNSDFTSPPPHEDLIPSSEITATGKNTSFITRVALLAITLCLLLTSDIGDGRLNINLDSKLEQTLRLLHPSPATPQRFSNVKEPSSSGSGDRP